MIDREHTFAICAYKESSFLEECILSLKKQKVKSEIIIVTSTPNEYISEMAKKYDIPLYINKGESGITQDWNYAYKKAKTKYVTIAHQDDVYLPEYSQLILAELRKKKNPIIAFTDYGELRNNKVVFDNKILKVKRFMLMPLRIRKMQSSKKIRRMILSFGSPICCPAVTYIKSNLPGEVFSSGFRSDEDWEAWEKLSRLKGEFVYIHKTGMYHRIHEESETSIILGDNARKREDYIMFCKFWPKFIAKILVRFYSESEKSNKL